MPRLEIRVAQGILTALEEAATQMTGFDCEPPPLLILPDNELWVRGLS
jgi:hypothetical protein